MEHIDFEEDISRMFASICLLDGSFNIIKVTRLLNGMTLSVFSMAEVFAEDCDSIRCSNFVAQVCSMVTAWDGTVIITRHHNICHLNKIRCRLRDIAAVTQVPDDKCIKRDARRVNDFSIVGAHQYCNHTCPLYCIDTYEPVCAEIWNKGRVSTRTMVNHCHVDLFSCSVGVNVTIKALPFCFNNGAALMFMTHMAGLNSMGFLDTDKRRSYTSDRGDLDNTKWEMDHILRRLLAHSLLKRLTNI